MKRAVLFSRPGPRAKLNSLPEEAPLSLSIAEIARSAKENLRLRKC